MEPSAYHQMAETEDRHWWYRGRRAIAGSVIAALDLPERARILEIGAGTGGNIAMLSRFGEVTAVEMSETARAIGNAKTGVPFLSGHLPDGLPLGDARFDLICLFDVLEHVEQDFASLEVIRDLLDDRGRLVLTVPAHQWLWSRHDVDLHHFRRYSRRGLAALAEAAGLRVERLTYTNSALFPAAAIARLADRLRSDGASAGSDLPPAPLNSLMHAIYAAERHVLPAIDLPMGVSLLAVLSRTRATDTVASIEQLAA
ncbi:MAG: class I SAM-dependent methyltransferase [Rhizobiaceae bacterium]|nr:class I SAM-dependent methyltransferase [Rhizobiaceae bacterium]MCV0405667.1 class I SAM-dependent methyltransferase [Rhizobiaceae bacterium]